MPWDTSNSPLLQAIRQRAEFLRKHPRIQPGQFPRDFIRQFGFRMLLQLERFDELGEITCSPEAILGHCGSEAERKRLQRGLKRLVAEGQLERLGRSEYRLTSG